jgi:hypothetical protein
VKLRFPLILSSDRACRGRVSKDGWIIDLGPEGGDKGGEIVAVRAPEDVSREPRSYTGHYLAPLLTRSAATPAHHEEGPSEVEAPSRRRRSSSLRQREAAE